MPSPSRSVLLLAAVTSSAALQLSPNSGNIGRRVILFGSPLAVAALQQSASAAEPCQATLTKRCLDSQGRSEGIFGENGLLAPAINAVSVPSSTGEATETPQQKMARIRKERMAQEAKNQSDEYIRMQSSVGTKSFGSTVSVQ